MGVLFLDPVTLAVLLMVVAYVWAVWRGRFHRWFGTPALWSVIAWRFPAIAVLVPVVAELVLRVLEGLGVVVGTGIGGAATYLAVYGCPAAFLIVWPPAWLLPRWARDRLARSPRSADPGLPQGAMPAVHGRRGHACRSRWTWRIDGVGGYVWLEGTRLRFRASDGGSEQDDAPFALDDESVAQFRFSSDGELRVDRPRGGLWGVEYLDIELRELDGIHVRGRLPWRRAETLVVQVADRGSVALLVADAAHLRARIGATREPRAPGASSP